LNSYFKNVCFTGLYGSVDEHLPPVDGVMIGRAAWHMPWTMRHVDSVIFGARDPWEGRSRRELTDEYLDYACDMQERYGSVKDTSRGLYGWSSGLLLKPLLGLFHGERGGNRFKDRLFAELHKNPKIDMRDALDLALTEVPLYVVDGRFT
jgi:tRNA-dihydrouridine synthase A